MNPKPSPFTFHGNDTYNEPTIDQTVQLNGFSFNVIMFKGSLQ